MTVALTLAAVHPLSTGDLIGGILLGGAGLGQGIRHYRGTVTWMLRYLPGETQFFTPLWGGIMLLCGVAADLLAPVSHIAAVIIAVPALAALAVTLLSLFWLPGRLLPRWFREWRAEGRRVSCLPGRSVFPGR
jgi:hypothetical protein